MVAGSSQRSGRANYPTGVGAMESQEGCGSYCFFSDWVDRAAVFYFADRGRAEAAGFAD